MSRGDKRDRDRAKTQARLAQKSKANAREGRPEDRNANDAAALQAKVAAKKAAKDAEAGNAPSKGPVARKAKNKKQQDLDDLLNAGLTTGKKKGAKA
ncbi:expressed unknown protein [Seminavis robusta]|uniref:Small EDRK-rich factor-like N-terminal domain-containing protein n=1 Tax=Seminavis robusta TaxID=568900 RepID=A0A9N8DKM5_9STRA|nr:expressed unknown protein [Seminavis robusta]|eukprot:Sro110_g054820.1 n/a (97) ;mRNA; r:32234-32657